MSPYKDKEMEKMSRKASIKRRVLMRTLLEFRVGDEPIVAALSVATGEGNRNKYIKSALIDKLKKDGYLDITHD